MRIVRSFLATRTEHIQLAVSADSTFGTWSQVDTIFVLREVWPAGRPGRVREGAGVRWPTGHWLPSGEVPGLRLTSRKGRP